MRRTESAEKMFGHASQFFQFYGTGIDRISEKELRDWLAGMRCLALGLADLSVAIRDVYDRLEFSHPRGRIVGTIERIPPS